MRALNNLKYRHLNIVKLKSTLNVVKREAKEKFPFILGDFCYSNSIINKKIKIIKYLRWIDKNYHTLICKVEMTVYRNPLVSSSVLVTEPSVMSAPDSFQLTLAAGLPPFEIHVRLNIAPSDADSLPLESA